jgi:hypothetical protein
MILLVLVSLFVTSAAFAQNGEPVGGCPAPFERHPFMDHEEHEDYHIGLAQDLNGDGWICVKHLSNGLHVHMDNVLP